MTEPYAYIIIKLLQDVIYNDEGKTWDDLLSFKNQVTEYFDRIGLEVIIDETDGFAFLRQPETEGDEAVKIVRLVRKQPLSYEISITLVVLREWLEEFDNRLETSKPFILHKDIRERLSMFFQDNTNKTKVVRSLNTSIAALENLGILKVNRDDAVKDNVQYEVRRILKAFISNEKLEEILNNLKNHAESV